MPLFFQAVEPPSAAPAIITNPDWKMRPTAQDMARVYPRPAARQGLAGVATLACAVTKEGKLTGCAVHDEAPTGAGFAAAALKLAPIFQIRPMTRDGVPVDGGGMRIPIRFTTPPNMRAGPLEFEHATLKGQTSEVNCRYRQQVLDNCIWMSLHDAVRLIAGQLEGAPFPAAPAEASGRVAITIKFKP